MKGCGVMFKTIELTKEGRLAKLKLNRPESMNAMNEKMMKELAEALESLHTDTSVQVVVIHGEGRAFSAGGDIKQMIDPEAPMDIEKVMVDVSRLAKALYSLPQITVAAVHGAAAGIGCSFILGCDYVIAEEDSKIAMNFIGIGLIPDGAGHFFLKERVGVAEAKKLIWSGRVLKGEEAKSAGLVDESVPTGQAAAVAEAYCQQLLASPILAMLETKRILHEQKTAELSTVLQMEAEAQTRMRKTADHQEGIRAFVEKRPPNFTGQ